MAFWDFSKSDQFHFDVERHGDGYKLTFEDSERYVEVKLTPGFLIQVIGKLVVQVLLRFYKK